MLESWVLSLKIIIWTFFVEKSKIQHSKSQVHQKSTKKSLKVLIKQTGELLFLSADLKHLSCNTVPRLGQQNTNTVLMRWDMFKLSVYYFLSHLFSRPRFFALIPLKSLSIMSTMKTQFQCYAKPFELWGNVHDQFVMALIVSYFPFDKWFFHSLSARNIECELQFRCDWKNKPRKRKQSEWVRERARDRDWMCAQYQRYWWQTILCLLFNWIASGNSLSTFEV